MNKRKDKIIIFTGLPGSGKGVQSSLISKNLKLPHITPGFWLRQKAKEDEEIKKYISKGEMVPDHITNSLISHSLIDENFTGVIDGFPRTIGHAEYLNKFLENNKVSISCVIHLEVPKNVIINRILNRYMCYQCNASYTHNIICCNKETERRIDDDSSTIQHRIEVHEKLYNPIQDYYKKNTIYININGNQEPNKVYEEIIRKLHNNNIIEIN